ncbi:MAG: cell envelope biogenesis protein TolA [Alphaproteobacteria bacterium]|nr:cell envelope biogenesis protein TolA [Alphaproteobacteria bacterium]
MERAEKIGFGIATAGHVLLFGVLSAGFLSTPNPLKLRTPPIEVQLVDEVGLEMAAPKISHEEMAASQAPEIGPTEEAERIAPKSPEPAPLPAPPQPKQAAPAPKPTKQARPKPTPPKQSESSKAQAKPKADKRARGSLLGSDFLKGIQTERPTKATATTPPAEKMSSSQVASLNAVIYRQLKPFWKPPSGADAELLKTQLSVHLNRDGSLQERPEVVGTTGVTPSNEAQVNLHQERAVQAVMRAAPFTNLPEQYYDQWKWLKPLNFDGRLAQ